MANHPDAYAPRPVAVLWAGRCLTPEQFCWAIHPANPDPLPTDDRGEIAVGSMVRLQPCPARPVGHDGATVERYPAVTAGHMRGDLT